MVTVEETMLQMSEVLSCQLKKQNFTIAGNSSEAGRQRIKANLSAVKSSKQYQKSIMSMLIIQKCGIIPYFGIEKGCLALSDVCTYLVLKCTRTFAFIRLHTKVCC